jgi:hypothetical protein
MPDICLECGNRTLTWVRGAGRDAVTTSYWLCPNGHRWGFVGNSNDFVRLVDTESGEPIRPL